MKALISAFFLTCFVTASTFPIAPASAAQSTHSAKHHKKQVASKKHDHKRVAHSNSNGMPTSGMKHPA